MCTRRFAAELREWFAPFRVGFPDWRQEITELLDEGDTVVARCRCRGKNLGEWLGVPATGRWMEVDEVWFFTVVEGRLDRMWSLEDTWSRLLQLGTAAQAIEAVGAHERPYGPPRFWSARWHGRAVVRQSERFLPFHLSEAGDSGADPILMREAVDEGEAEAASPRVASS